MPPIEAYPLIALIGTISFTGTVFAIKKGVYALKNQNKSYNFEDSLKKVNN